MLPLDIIGRPLTFVHVSIMKADIILFDWDNTLSDTFPALHDSYNHMLRHFGREEWDVTTAKANIRHVAHEYLPTLFGERWEEALDVYRTYYRSTHATSPAFEKATDLMVHLKSNGARLGIISNKNEAILQSAYELSPYKPYMDVVLGALAERPGKPDPMVMELALQQLGHEGPRENIWYVGDTDVDMEFARNAGVKSVFIENAGLDRMEDIQLSHKPDLAFKSLADFLKHLD